MAVPPGKRGASGPDGGPTKLRKQPTIELDRQCIAIGTKSPEVGDTVWYQIADGDALIGQAMHERGIGPVLEQAPDQMVICRNILGGKIEWPAQIQPYAECKSVIQALLKKDVAKRLGCMKGGAKDIKQHAWFKSMNWGKLRGSASAVFARRICNPLLLEGHPL